MVQAINAQGFMGLALEAVPGVYEPPTKFFPFRSENFGHKQDTNMRRPIMGVSDIVGAVPGNVNVEGDIEIEAMEDVLPYFLYAARNTVEVQDDGPDFTYTFTPTHQGVQTPSTLSLTVIRNEEVFGYAGCVVPSQEYTVDNGLLIAKFGVSGREEVDGAMPNPNFTDTVPFGAGQYSVEIPAGTPVADTDTFTLTIDDSGEPQHRLRGGGFRGPSFIKFGERSTTIQVERDFLDRQEYLDYKALTDKSITIKVEKGADNSIEFQVPVNIIETYDLGLSGQGDLVRASISYSGVYDFQANRAYRTIIKNQEEIILGGS